MQIMKLILDEEKAVEAIAKEARQDDWIETRFAEIIDQTLSRAAQMMEIPFTDYLNALRTIRDYVDEGEYEVAMQLQIQLAEQLDTNSKKILESLFYGGDLSESAYLEYLSEYVIDWYELERIFMMREKKEGWPDGCYADSENSAYTKYLKRKYGVTEVTDEECESDGNM